MTKIYKINSLKWDEKLYPRTTMSHMRIYKYSQQMKAGAKFPSITVAEHRKKFFVIDGWHRIKAKEMLKEKTIEATEVKFNKDNWFVEALTMAISSNVSHGQSLAPYELAKVSITLKNLGLSQQKISEIIRVPVSNMKKFIGDRIVQTTLGESLAVKGAFKHLAGTVQDPKELERISQGIRTRSQIILFKEVIKILENNLLDLENKEAMRCVNRINRLLKKI